MMSIMTLSRDSGKNNGRTYRSCFWFNLNYSFERDQADLYEKQNQVNVFIESWIDFCTLSVFENNVYSSYNGNFNASLIVNNKQQQQQQP